MTMLSMRYGARWAFFMREAAISLDMAKTAPTRKLRRLWLDQACSEMDRAAEARQ